MSILELFSAVKEQNLTKTQLENYHSVLSSLYADMSIEVAEIKKERAVYYYERTKPDVSDISIRRSWEVTEKGQRLILVEAYVKATSKLLSSLKSRLYSIY
jgi:hypothetical protein